MRWAPRRREGLLEGRRHRSVRLLPLGSTLLTLALLAAGCSLSPGGGAQGGGAGGEPAADAEALPVLVATAELRDLTADLRLSGSLEPDRTAPLVSLTGGRVAEVYFDEGEPVEAGTVVLRLDAGELTAHLNQ